MLSSLLKVIPISSPTWHGGPDHDKVTPVVSLHTSVHGL